MKIMDEEMEYAEMLEIPVSTVNVTKKRGRKPKKEVDAQTNATVNEYKQNNISAKGSKQKTSQNTTVTKGSTKNSAQNNTIAKAGARNYTRNSTIANSNTQNNAVVKDSMQNSSQNSTVTKGSLQNGLQNNSVASVGVQYHSQKRAAAEASNESGFEKEYTTSGDSGNSLAVGNVSNGLTVGNGGNGLNMGNNGNFSADTISDTANEQAGFSAADSALEAKSSMQVTDKPSHSELAHPKQSITESEWFQHPTLAAQSNNNKTRTENNQNAQFATAVQQGINKASAENDYREEQENNKTFNTLEGYEANGAFDFIPQENAIVSECSPIAIPRRKKRPFLARLFGKKENVWTYENEEEAKTAEPFPDEIEQDEPQIYNYSLYQNKLERDNTRQKRYSLIAGIEFAACVTLCAGIFLTNVFYPTSAINTFFRSISQSTKADARTYSDFTLSAVLSEENAELNLSPTGILSFTEKGCVYPAVDGTVTDITQNADGTWMVKIAHSPTFTGIINGLSYAACSVGSELKSNIPVGYSDGETEVQVSLYDDGALLNCFYVTENGDLAWTEE